MKLFLPATKQEIYPFYLFFYEIEVTLMVT